MKTQRIQDTTKITVDNMNQKIFFVKGEMSELAESEGRQSIVNWM